MKIGRKSLLFICIAASFDLRANTSPDCRGLAEEGKRQNIITSVTGREFSLKFFFGDKELALSGAQQPEYERRATLEQSFPLKFSRFSERLDDYADYKISTPSELVADLLDNFFVTARERVTATRNAGYDRDKKMLWLRPLQSSKDHWHSGQRIENAATLRPEDFTTVLQGKKLSFPSDGGGVNTLAYQFLVGVQKERSTYYDTESSALAAEKIAIRVKGWSVKDSNSEVPVARSLFLKKTVNSSSQSLTERLEYQVKLPEQFSEEAVIPAAAALLKMSGSKIVGALRPVVRVDNERWGIDLTWGLTPENSIKVGFMTIDNFRVYKLPDGRPLDVVQFEYEIFPDHIETFRRNEASFGELFQYIERMYGAKQDTTPKYQKAMK